MIFLIQLSANASYALTKESLFSLNLHNKSMERGFFELACLSGSRIKLTGQNVNYNFVDKAIDNLSLTESIKYMLSDFNNIILYGNGPSGEPEFDIFIFSKKPLVLSATTITEKPRSHRLSVIQDIVSNPESKYTTISAYASESTSPIDPFFSPLSSGFSENDLEQIPAYSPDYSIDLTIVPSDSTSEGLTVGDFENWDGLRKISTISEPVDLPITPTQDNTGISIASATYQDVKSLRIPDFPSQLTLMPPDSEDTGLTFGDLKNERGRNMAISKPFVDNEALPLTPPGKNVNQHVSN